MPDNDDGGKRKRVEMGDKKMLSGDMSNTGPAILGREPMFLSEERKQVVNRLRRRMEEF